MIARRRPRLSQHLLHDRRVASRIAAAVQAPEHAHVLEIGPGRGALTEHLLDLGFCVTVVELDPAMVGALRDRFGSSERLTVVEADILEFRLEPLGDDGAWHVVGNLPYAITTPILFHLLEQVPWGPIADQVYMIQREVAERLVAEPGGRAIGALTVTVGLVADVEILFDVGPGAFRPPPAVWSTVVRITPHDRWGIDVERLERLRTLVRGAFGYRRKQLKTSLRLAASIALSDRRLAAVQERTGLDLARRPETLTIDEWLSLEAGIRAVDTGG